MRSLLTQNHINQSKTVCLSACLYVCLFVCVSVCDCYVCMSVCPCVCLCVWVCLCYTALLLQSHMWPHVNKLYTWQPRILKFCFKTCVAMKFVDDDDDENHSPWAPCCYLKSTSWLVYLMKNLCLLYNFPSLLLNFYTANINKHKCAVWDLDDTTPCFIKKGPKLGPNSASKFKFYENRSKHMWIVITE